MLFDRLADVPVTVTLVVPAAAALLTVNVSVLLLVVLLGLKDAVTPLGSPEADKLTVPVKPFCGTSVMLLVPLAPGAMLRLPGEADSAKLGAVTVRVREAVLVRLPEVPVMVTVEVPGIAPLPAFRVSVLVPAVALGLKDAVTPPGRPDADKLTVPLNPLCGETEMVLVPLVPGAMLKLAGDADRPKVGAAVIVSATDVALVKTPEVPVIVTVAFPGAAVLLAVKVSVLLPVVLLGLKAAVTPLGRFDADKLTLPLKPFCGETEMVPVAVAPGAMPKAFGEADSVKLGAGPEPVETVTLSKVAVA